MTLLGRQIIWTWTATLLLAMTGVLISTPRLLGRQMESSQQDGFDIVEYRKDLVSPRKVLTGILKDRDDRQVVMDLGTNGMRNIPNDQILSIQLASRPDVRQASRLAREGRFSEAAEAWQSAAKTHPESWLQRHAWMQCCQCQQVQGQTLTAISTFLTLSQDPDHVPWEAAPLFWVTAKVDPVLDRQMEAWLKHPDPVRQMIAASYGLQNQALAQPAREVMQRLSQTKQQPMSALATAQLWRLDLQPSEVRLSEMNAFVKQLDHRWQAGPLLVLGRLKKQSGKSESATADFLRVATMYPDQHPLVLLGLDQAYLTLNGLGDPGAEAVGRWLKQRFPDSSAALAVP